MKIFKNLSLEDPFGAEQARSLAIITERARVVRREEQRDSAGNP